MSNDEGGGIGARQPAFTADPNQWKKVVADRALMSPQDPRSLQSNGTPRHIALRCRTCISPSTDRRNRKPALMHCSTRVNTGDEPELFGGR